ncbi:7,8-dihydro-8-oxoguanine-triphosphatase [Thalassotalea insulae]|uniref:8-oxo-dGTP diphosphatase n=1 Tax=Thalassotalea insulae TaxID=2056778 RepID=A0ABQ6GPD4_9GAMM|nr:8-oxo-dGTP diphosphatase MutT [Thalassotalea insulae]GLX77787.1 7,8-dihydro-8-oxoguanine-triphosphatase [Thalassotalea insulae]
MKQVHVAVGVIVSDGEFFLTRRHPDVHQGGKWEFPGGKVEVGETVAQALYRELKEEVAIEVLTCRPLIEIAHDYGDKSVLLAVYLVDNFQGEPSAQEGQQQGWFALSELATINFPEANKAIVEKLMTIYQN